MEYKGYRLDPFQEKAIRAIDEGKSVIVAAPTGAGKTLIAEYAVERCLSEGKKVIYTAPIKALSNQKYRDFFADYGNMIGIMTGDVVINPDAPALIMTTEIYRNTIFDDISRLDQVDYVIFDEIHFINDSQRGTVWEESIIFSPQHVKFLGLSATMPNIDQFVRWMREIRKKPIELVEERNRPVPLEQHLYIRNTGIGGLAELKAIREMMQRYRIRNTKEIDPELLENLGIQPCNSIVDYLKDNDKLPCLFFCFSRSRCEEYASWFSDRDFLYPHERKEILDLYDSLCRQFNLIGEPGYDRMRQMISHGVAYHHAGILPTFKEVIERLFTSGLIKLLFTTETFAVGINMPARTVAFEGLEKYDGIEFRYLKTREFHQMSGRAGRRGIDTVGYVYAQVDPYFSDIDEVDRIVSEQVEPIESQFNLSYSSILNLYAQYGEALYDVCELSLSNFQSNERIVEIERQLDEINRSMNEMELPRCVRKNVDPMRMLARYRKLSDEIEEAKQELQKIRRRLGTRRSQRGRFGQAKIKLARLTRRRKSLPCHRCQNRDRCLKLYIPVAAAREKRAELIKAQENARTGLRERINRKLNVLKELAYIDETGLLPRGIFASQIYGYEMQVTQLFFEGYFERIDENALNVLVMAIVFESKKDDWFRKLHDKKLNSLLSSAKTEIEMIRQTELKYLTGDMTPQIDTSFSAAALAWSEGCDFHELKQYSSLAEGDIVRAFRNAIDLLRQMRRAVVEHPSLHAKLGKCIDKIKRDVIDAEKELRLDQNIERQAMSGEPFFVSQSQPSADEDASSDNIEKDNHHERQQT